VKRVGEVRLFGKLFVNKCQNRKEYEKIAYRMLFTTFDLKSLKQYLTPPNGHPSPFSILFKSIKTTHLQSGKSSLKCLTNIDAIL